MFETIQMIDEKEFVDETVENLRNYIGGGRVVLGASGGGDSTVTAALLGRAGIETYAIFVDNGLVRKNEPKQVKEIYLDESLARYPNLHFISVDASGEYFEELAGVIDPEQKRKIIGHKFIEVFEKKANEIGNIDYLVQGTIAPDWIESGGELRDIIKSHHNVGGLPEELGLDLVEPVRELYKDEIRKLINYLDLPVKDKQPFPGPGLAIRILGEVTPKKIKIVREACYIVEEEFEKAAEAGEMDLPWQYFAVLTGMKSVGVHGDVRHYADTIVVRAVESTDAMTANYSKIPHDVLERISLRITNSMGHEVVRVVYDITNKPPGTIEWE